MPEKSKQREWARKQVGWIDMGDASLPRMRKAEAIERLHEFFIHGSENRITPSQLLGYIAEIGKSLSIREVVGAYRDHEKNKGINIRS